MKKLVMIVLCLALLVQASACASAPASPTPEPIEPPTLTEPPVTAFRPVSFGMTKDEVKEAEADMESLKDFDDNWLVCDTEIAKFPCKLYYGFNDDGALYGIGYTLDLDLGRDSALTDSIIEVYGRPDSNQHGVRLRLPKADTGARAAIPESVQGDVQLRSRYGTFEWSLDDMDICMDEDVDTHIVLISFLSKTVSSPSAKHFLASEFKFPGLSETDFGKDRDHIKSIIEKSKSRHAFVQDNNDGLTYALRFFDINTALYYKFNSDGELYSIIYAVGDDRFDLNSIDDADICLDVYGKLQEALTYRYGTPTDDRELWPNNNAAEYEQIDYLLALAEGDLKYETTWELDQVAVTLRLHRVVVLEDELLFMGIEIRSNVYQE